MTPAVPAVLGELAALLIRNAAPGLPDAERASDLGLSAALLNVAAEVWDGMAAKLIAENRAFARLLGVPPMEEDLRISGLQAENARLRRGLIAAQAQAEANGDAAGQEAIWAALVASAERWTLSISPA